MNRKNNHTKLEEYVVEKNNFIAFINYLDKKMKNKEVTFYEKEFLIKTITKGETPKSYIHAINTQIIKKTSELENRRKLLKYKTHAIISLVTIFFIISLILFL